MLVAPFKIGVNKLNALNGRITVNTLKLKVPKIFFLRLIGKEKSPLGSKPLISCARLMTAHRTMPESQINTIGDRKKKAPPLVSHP